MTEMLDIKIERVTRKNKAEFEKLLDKLWSGATLEDCKTDAKKTMQFLCKLGGEYVGLITASVRREHVAGRHGKKVCYLEGIYVLDEYKNKGIETEILAHFENWARRKGIKEIASDCEIENNASLNLHKKLGFSVVETTIHLKKNL